MVAPRLLAHAFGGHGDAAMDDPAPRRHPSSSSTCAAPLAATAALPTRCLSPAWRRAVLSSFLFSSGSGGIHWHAPIDDAAATSTYLTREGAPASSPFGAKQALRPGTGYWCSAGEHKPSDLVTWKGTLKHRRKVSGLKVSWAYAPEEVRVRTTADGLHWDEPVRWHKEPLRDEVAFEEDMTFDRPRHVMDLKIEMKKGRAPWHFLGINQATLVL